MYASRTADNGTGAQESHDEDIQQTVIAQIRLERKLFQMCASSLHPSCYFQS